jgi:hypothetical protein
VHTTYTRQQTTTLDIVPLPVPDTNHQVVISNINLQQIVHQCSGLNDMHMPRERRRRPWRRACRCWSHFLLLPQRALTLVLSPTISPYEQHQYQSTTSAPIVTSTSMLSQQRIHKTKRSSANHLYMSYSSSSSSSRQKRSSPSPWSPGKWKMTLVFGNDNTQGQTSNNLGKEWGSDGGRLALSFEVLVTGETVTIENSKQHTWLGGKPMGTLMCISQRRTNIVDVDDDGGATEYCASYVNERGQQNVQILSGQWRIEPPLPLLPSYSKALSGQASTLRFYFTLATAITRNTISFPENQLLLLQSNAFRADQYDNGIKTLLPYQYAKDNAQMLLDHQLNHETGDRRLDGSDIFETLGGYRDIAQLVMERDEKKRRWGEIERVLPKLKFKTSTQEFDISNLIDDDDRWGIWPGDTELITLERGTIFAATARESKQSSGLFPWMQPEGVEDLVAVGKWTVLPIFE